MERPRNFISSSNLLTSREINRLSKDSLEDDLRDLCRCHPNEEDRKLLNFLSRRKEAFKFFCFLETHEFANLVVLKTQLPYKTALNAFRDEAFLITGEITGALPAFPKGSSIEFLYTHEPVVSRRLSELAERYGRSYLEYVSKRGIRLPPSLVRAIKHDSGNCDKLRLFCTNSPEAIKEESASVVRHRSWYISSPEKSASKKAAEQFFKTDFILIG